MKRVKIKLHDICETDYIITPSLLSCGVDQSTSDLVLNTMRYHYSNKDYLASDAKKIRIEMMDDKNWSDTPRSDNGKESTSSR